MPVDTYIAAEILATCNALGSNLKGNYAKSSDCLHCLKDLVLYLRRDDEDHSVLRQLGDLNLLQTDLLPLLKRYSSCQEIHDMTLRLLVILTNPAFLLYKEEIPSERTALNVYNTLVSNLQSYKQAFTDLEVWTSLFESLRKLLAIDLRERTEDDKLSIEKILIITRNILHVAPTDADEKRTSDDVNLHDQVLWALHLSKMDTLFLYLSQNSDESEYCLHVLEIISLMLREHSPSRLVTAGQSRTASEKEHDSTELGYARKKEAEARLARKRKQYSRFDSTYYVKNIKSIGENDYISHKFVTKSDCMSFDSEKAGRKTRKNRIPVPDVETSRSSTLAIRAFLKEFCNEVLSNAYNSLMSTVKRFLVNKKLENHDESYFLWAMHYFLEFNRLGTFELDRISETISVQSFHYVQMIIEKFYEMLQVDKSKVKYWSRRMHLGLKAYKELLQTIHVMATNNDMKRCSDTIKSNIFYVVEYRELLLTLLLNYDEVRFSMSYLTDLIEATSLFLSMFTSYIKQHSQLVVQKKKRKKIVRKKKKKASQPAIPSDCSWDDISGVLSALMQGRKPVPTEVNAFDATSELSMEEQKLQMMVKIHNAMLDNNSGYAVALLRVSRELWPENNEFGTSDIEPEDEFMLLKSIFDAELPRNKENIMVEEDTEEPEVDVEEEEEMEKYTVEEQQLDRSDFFNRFATFKVIHPCSLLLANYEKNMPSTNMAVLKIMHKIAMDCKMHALFFQASLFSVFQKILHDERHKFDPVVKELSRFAKYILKKFFDVAKENKKVFVEMLFWKGSREAYELEEGYGAYVATLPKKRKKKAKKNGADDTPVLPEELMPISETHEYQF